MTRRLLHLLSLLLVLAPARALVAEPAAPPISGVVSHLQKPISDALVVFYNLGDTSLTRSRTAPDGTFVVPSAPIGVYDLIAYKKGFLPTLVRIWHPSLTGALSAVRIQLRPRGASADSAAASESTVWELRDRVPTDVLREISLLEDGFGVPNASLPAGDHTRIDRALGGEVRSVADVSAGDTSLSRTAVGVRGGLPNGWTYDLRGDYAAVADSAGIGADASRTTGNSAGIALDVAPSDVDHVSVTTRRHTLSFHDDRAASLQTHAVSWSRGEEEGSVESVAARYVDETNLYRATSAGTSFFPIASRTWEVKAKYARPAGDSPGVSVGMTYRHREGTIGPSAVGNDGALLLSAPDADLSASAITRVSSRSEVEGGVVARYLSGGYGVAPRIAARYRVGGQTYLFVRGLYRVSESVGAHATVLPLVASIEDNSDATARKAFAVGLERNAGQDGSFRLEASNQRVGEAVRAFFEGDFLTDFDSVYLFDGNMLRQYRATATQRLSDTVSGTLAVRYGTIEGDLVPETGASFGITANRGQFWTARAGIELLPTRTGIALLLRGARQHLVTNSGTHLNESDKIAISIAQDLSVIGLTPFGSDCKLLVAIESARSTAARERDDASVSNRLLGGLAISF
ncbi:MAG: carboxypeptidase-like regulatory domain-containing protein [Acidobacteriota bacterium]